MALFNKVEQILLKFIFNHKNPQLVKACFTKKEKNGRIIHPDFKLYYKVINIKIDKHNRSDKSKNSHTDQWDRIKAQK